MPINHKAVFLVVDDFDPMRKVTVNQLRTLGVSQIFTAANGSEALRMLRAQKIDIVLSDWNMPVLSGLDLFKAMRNDPALAETPFILITAEAERRQIDEAIAAREEGKSRTIRFGLSGHGFLDLGAYDNYLAGKMVDVPCPEEDLTEGLKCLPKV